jgi:hypothetical protein
MRKWTLAGAEMEHAMKTAIICLAAVLAALASAHAETKAQKLKYMQDLTGTSCSADKLAVHASPGGAVTVTLPPPAYVTVIRGELDAKGSSWVYVSHDATRKQVGWVRLDDLSCI